MVVLAQKATVNQAFEKRAGFGGVIEHRPPREQSARRRRELRFASLGRVFNKGTVRGILIWKSNFAPA